jgi:hypothetical protein
MSEFQKKKLDNGSKNPNYVDLCEEDATIPSQKFVCISFISPEKVLKQREQFIFEKFVQQWDFSKSIEKFGDFINFISYKYKLKLDDVMADMKDYVTEEKTHLKSYSVTGDFNNFMDKAEDKITEEFNRLNSFQTSVRGVKIRGSYSSQSEAELRAKKLREADPHHDIFVGPVGVWMPWDPDAYKTGRVEFMEEELNQLHQEKMKNEEKAKQEFDQRVRDAKRKAIEENVKKARESGNKLTQTLTEDGELVGVTKTVNFDDREVAEIKPSSGFGKATVPTNESAVDSSDVDSSAAGTDELNRVD